MTVKIRNRYTRSNYVACHKLIRATAIEMAAELFQDMMAQDNKLWAEWKAQCRDLTPARLEIMWIELMWPKLIDTARATLARMLSTPIAEPLKQSIFRALIADAKLRHTREHIGQARH